MDNPLYSKSKQLAINIVRLYKSLSSEKGEYILSKQLLRSGTSIGANIREGKRAQSDADFVSKMSIALKEAEETLYWLEILHDTDYITTDFDAFYEKTEEIVKILESVIRAKKYEMENSQTISK